MNKHLFLIFIFITITLYSCAPNNSEIITPTYQSPVAVGAEVSTISPAQNTPMPVATLTHVLSQPINEMAATATLTFTPTHESDGSVPRVCTSPPQQFNVHEVLDMSILHLRFENENLLTFEGWTQGSEPIVIPVTPEPTPDMLPSPNISTRRLLVGGQLSLPEGQLSSRPLNISPLLNNPCDEDCPLEIIGQSPNEKWQLVQIHDWLVQKSGIWLVSTNEAVRLIPYITDLNWQWATDSSLLWVVYSDTQLGSHSLVAQLDAPVITRSTGSVIEDLSYLLDPWLYIIAFSPVDKVAISTPSFEFQGYDTDELFTINLTEPFTLTDSTKLIPGLVTVSWNEATQSFLLEIMKESGVEIQDLSGNTLIMIPRHILEVFRFLPIPDEEQSLEPLEPYFRIGNYALSPLGERLAVVQNSNLLLFDCKALATP